MRTLNKTDKQQQGLIEGSVRHVALLRYDAFEDVGGRLSFSCAMLDEHGTGVVLTSINGRQETRVYAKPIADGGSSYNLSSEEEEAIRQAIAAPVRGGGGAMIFKKDEDDETQLEDVEPRTGPRVGARSHERRRRRWRRTVRSRSSASVRVWTGNVVSAGSLRIDGQVKGQINADGDVDALAAEPGRGRHPRAERLRGRPLQGEHRREG